MEHSSAAGSAVPEPVGRAGSTRRPSVSVVLPVHGHPPGIDRCLRAVHAAGPDELILVIDGNDARTHRSGESVGAEVVVISERRGPAAARNLGVRRAASDIVLFIDSDVLVPPDVVGRVAEALASDGELDAVFGSYDDTPTAAGFFSQYRNLLHHWVHQHGRAEATTFWGACGAIRRTVFLDAGGFDEGFGHPSVEDIELGHRLIRRGCRIRLEPSLQVTHTKRWTFREMVRTDLLRRAAPWTELILRDRLLADDLNLRYRDRACVVLAAVGVSTLMVTPVAPGAAVVVASAVGMIALLNGRFLGFVRRKRGLGFMLRAVPAHALFYVVGGLGFVVGVLRYVFLPRRRRYHASPTEGENAA